MSDSKISTTSGAKAPLARKIPVRIPRSPELAAQTTIMLILQRLPDDTSRRRTMAAVMAHIAPVSP